MQRRVYASVRRPSVCLSVCLSHHGPQHTHTHPFNGPLSGTTRVSRYQKGKTNLDFTEARDSEWQWHQLDIYTQVCNLLHHATTPPLSFWLSVWSEVHTAYSPADASASDCLLLQ